MPPVSPAPGPLLAAFTPAAIIRARTLGKRGAMVAMLSVIIFVCLTAAVATVSLGAGQLSPKADGLLRAAMTVALLGFFVGSHIWMLAPFAYKKETSRRRLAAMHRLRLQSPEVASMLTDIERQRRAVLRGEVDQALRRHRKLLAQPVPRMRTA